MRSERGPMRLDGKVTIVTGGGAGLGRAFAIGLAAEGAKMAVTDIDRAAAQQVADEISTLGARLSRTHWT